MKRMLRLLVTALFYGYTSLAQLGNPANFGIEGELSANQPTAGIDDWFIFAGGSGLGIIDTTGAAAIKNTILGNLDYSFVKKMAYPTYSVQNSKLLIDALYARDYNSDGGELTVMLGNKTKNGANPMTQWLGGPGNVGGGANDIIDMYAHVRRDGSAITNDLWVYGAITYGFTGGSHYFDYEFYQSQIGFTPPVSPATSSPFTNSGNDEGHTAWRFLPDGTLVSVGDVAVAIGYNGTAVNAIEVRVWVKESDYNSITPKPFKWDGAFDKLSNSNQYGYASIVMPASAFYSKVNTDPTAIPAAPWGTVRSGSHFETTYEQGKFLEFGVNFTALGVDNQLVAGQNPCIAPFKALMVKSRTGSSFTADLKDFLGPYDFTNISAPAAAAGPDATMCSGSGAQQLLSVSVSPGASGYFSWTSQAGTGIVSRTDSSAVYVNDTGTYYVQSYLYTGCPTASKDTIQVLSGAGCLLLDANTVSFDARLANGNGLIRWMVDNPSYVKTYELEKSVNGISFSPCYVLNVNGANPANNFEYLDRNLVPGADYYRLKMQGLNGAVKYSSVKQIMTGITGDMVRQVYGTRQVVVQCAQKDLYTLEVFDTDGKKMHCQKFFMDNAPVKIQLGKLPGNKVYYYRVSGQCGEVATGKLLL